MQADYWDRVQGIFLSVADLPPGEQEQLLDVACSGDSALRTEIESLLASDRKNGAGITAAVGTEAALLFDSPVPGDRLGAYRIIYEIGRGGMGAVYLATRADDQYRKQVAIKVVKRGMDSDEVLGRFRHERQILAGLEHPHIARLIDGGTTPDGRPYFVMERVQGQPIDAYCREHNLGVESRLRLFLRVCEAVSYAHRALVVHRDLKPGNILVNAEGVPKLLDFGVAKLLSPGADPGLTSTGFRTGPLTPEYASPEQVRGLAVTTATDVYALGAILYELLTGTRAQKMTTRTPAEIERVVCDTQTLRPSHASLALQLDGDLDNIVWMAMRKERERRYQSVDQLAEDIGRYLSGLPVMARQDSFAYRARKFVGRNRLAIAAGALVFGSLVAGIAVSVNQTRQAEAARRVAEMQKQAAERERVRAEAETQVAKTEEQRAARRLTQMVELADSSLHEVHSAIEKLAGATEARRQLVATTLQFLQNLSQDSGQDDRLRLVLSAAYMKVADVQGGPLQANLGDSTGALTNYQKSIALIEPLLKKEPERPEYLMQWVDDRIRLGDLLRSMGSLEQALASFRGALPAAQKLARRCPGNPDCRLKEADIYSGLSLAKQTRDPAGALVYSAKQIQSLERTRRAFPDNPSVTLELATAYSQAAAALNRRGELREASDDYRRAIDLREGVFRSHPADAAARRLVMITYGNLAGTLGSPLYFNLGDTAGAREYYGKALAIARDLAHADTNNHLAQYDLAYALLLYASLDLPKEEWEASLTMLRESEAILQKVTAADPSSLSKMRPLAMAQEYEGHRLEGLSNRTEAIAYYRRSLATAERALARSPSEFFFTFQAVADEEALAAAQALEGDRNAALEMARRAVARSERIASQPGVDREVAKGKIADAYRQLGAVHATFGEWLEARAAAERADAAWRQLAEAGSKAINRTQVDKAEALLKEASAHLQ